MNFQKGEDWEGGRIYYYECPSCGAIVWTDKNGVEKTKGKKNGTLL